MGQGGDSSVTGSQYEQLKAWAQAKPGRSYYAKAEYPRWCNEFREYIVVTDDNIHAFAVTVLPEHIGDLENAVPKLVCQQAEQAISRNQELIAKLAEAR
jgi:hypothetical protein